MKRFSVYFAAGILAVFSLALTACTALPAPKGEPKGSCPALAPEAYLRIHVRANDNTPEAQAVKYAVKNALTAYLSPLLAVASTKQEATAILAAHLGGIDEIASRVLQENGFAYRAKSALKKEAFPTRVYDEACLPEGVYDALIVTLGKGKGDNWWCVAYPPLCFLPSAAEKETFTYRSALWDWIKDLLG
ncbi:MAG: stage II sporulation protein R [Clostridia bacterium]|nr:stage II sporulation protein R [Clostridia bacterium]